MSPKKSSQLESREKTRKSMMWVAWVVVIIFGLSCVGFIIGGVIAPGQKKAPETSRADTGKVDEMQREINYWVEQARLNPTDPLILGNLAYQYQKAKRLDKAIEFYKKSLELDSEYTFAIHHLAQIYFFQNKYDLAIESWEKAISLEPDNSQYYLGLGAVYVKEERFYKATDVINKAIEIDPGNLVAYEVLAKVYDELNEKSKAIKTLQEALEIAKIKGDQRALEYFKKSISQIKNIPAKK